MTSRYSRSAIMLVAIALTVPALPAAAPFAGVSLKVSKEPVPPGGMAQVKVFVTEPKPISTGRGGLGFAGFDTIDGIALISPAEDTLGVAVVRGTDVTLSFVSPSATFGTNLDYPVLTVAGRVAADTPLGIKFPITLDAAALLLFDPLGARYPVDTKPGHIVTAPGVSVDAVQPGSADLPAGSVVTILGTGFDPLTKVRFDEVALADVRYVSATRIDVVLAAPARMHGMRIKVTNPDGSRSVYYSYQRARRQGVSDHPVLRDTVPVFPRPSVVSAQVDIAGSATGLALQNIGATAATVRVELVAADGTMLATTQLVVGASRFVVQELSEIFAVPYSAAQRVEVLATAPIQVMGIAVDATGAATPLPARKKP